MAEPLDGILVQDLVRVHRVLQHTGALSVPGEAIALSAIVAVRAPRLHAHVIGRAAAQVVCEGVRGDLERVPGLAVLVLEGAGLELALDDDRLALVQSGPGVLGQPVPALDVEVRRLTVTPLPGLVVPVPRTDAHPHPGEPLAMRGGADGRVLRHITDEGHIRALAHFGSSLSSGGPTPPGPLHRARPRITATDQPSPCG